MNKYLQEYLERKRKKYAATALPTSMPISSDKKESEEDDSPDIKAYGDFDDGYEKVPVGVKSLIGASKKLLAINRGETESDDRDALKYKRILNVDDLMAERVRMDAGKLRNNIMYRLSKARSLKHFPTNVFDSYVLGHIVGNSLSLPSEEINPLYLLDQQSRTTLFGQGGIGSADAISKEAQNVNPSQFAYLDPLASPDGLKAGADLRLAHNTRIGKKDGRLYTQVRDRKTGKVIWITPDELSDATVLFPD